MRSLTLRLGLLYMGLLSVSVFTLGGVLYLRTVHSPLSVIKQRIEREASALQSLSPSADLDALAQALAKRASAGGPRMPYHALVRADERVVTSNLPRLPPQLQPGWVRLDAKIEQDGELVDHEALLLATVLADGTRVLVGRDIEDLDEAEEKLLTAVIGVVAGAMLLGAGGGWLMGFVINRRLRKVSNTARQIMEGDLSRRIPSDGGQDEFERLNATLNQMLARNEQLFEAVRRVSDNVAHELRTPLARLRARLEHARLAADPGGQAALDAALNEAGALEKTFDAVLRIARIESGRHDSHPTKVELSALVRDAVEVYQPASEERGQTLEVKVADGLVVTGDRHLLFQAMCNLLDNAVKYGREGGRIEVEASGRDGAVEIRITDDGPGIAPEHRGRVMERFYRVASTASAPGAGLGLSLVAAVVERHHARLEFDDARPGLTVRWMLPA
jgi:signal transduction histidine kinase